MFPLNSSSLRTRDSDANDRINKNIELHDTDVTELRSFSIDVNSSPRFRPGELVRLTSGGSSVFRRVERIETIAGDCIVIWLDPRYVGAADTRANRSVSGE